MAREVGEFLYTHPNVVHAQVIGVPDTRYGEELRVWVKRCPGVPALTAEAVWGSCTGKLGHHKIPVCARGSTSSR